MDPDERRARRYHRKPTTRPRGLTQVPPEIRKRFGKVKVCTRAVAAFILNISVYELRQREKDGIYPVAADLRGRHWFDEENIRRIAGDISIARSERARGKPLTLPQKLSREKDVTTKETKTKGYSPKLAAQVFAELDSGKPLNRIIIEKEVHPEDALAIVEAWARVMGFVLFKKSHLAELNHLPWRADWPPKNAEQFVLILRSVMESDLQRCVKCQRGYARLCATCAPVPKTNGASSDAASASASEPAEKTIEKTEEPAAPPKESGSTP